MMHIHTFSQMIIFKYDYVKYIMLSCLIAEQLTMKLMREFTIAENSFKKFSMPSAD